jgi:hypothetical protein
MGLRESMEQIAKLPYDPKSPARLDQPIFDALEQVRVDVASWCPIGYTVRSSQGVGGLPDSLWVAALNDEVTPTPTEGTYLVFLFNTDRTTVSLSLNQGHTAAKKRARLLIPRRSGRALLRAEAIHMRTLLPEEELDGYSREIEIGTGDRPRGYEAGNVVSHTWPLTDLPDEDSLRLAFDSLVDLYERVVLLKEEELVIRPGAFATPARARSRDSTKKPVFAPKSSDDYIVSARFDVEPQVRRRTHEDLVRRLGIHGQSLGWVAATNHHPIDLSLSRTGEELLVEAKILDPRHPAGGVRESIGQLFEYRRFLRPVGTSGRMFAAYDVRPPGAHLDLLGELGILAAWRAGESFSGPGADALAAHS